MIDIYSDIEKLVIDDHKLKNLLRIEKQRRGARQNNLVFVGMRNIADYYWCAMKSYFDSMEDEPRFFASYLLDRLKYSAFLGKIDVIPKNNMDILAIGDELSLSDVELILSIQIQEDAENNYSIQNSNVKDSSRIDEHPIERGKRLHATKAEKYPTIRWNFEWNKFVIIGVPDGLEEQYVYEYKTTSNQHLYNFIKPIALAQADLYGFFFKRLKKRVQITILSNGETRTIDEFIDKTRATELLENFKQVSEGFLPMAPKHWKCNKCKYIAVCPIKHAT